MSAFDLWWWVILPYASIVVFLIGHVWRWRYDQFGWTSRSTQLQERRLLKWGAPLFHYATFAAIFGHVLGVLIPRSVTEALGISERVYTAFSGIAGSIAAIGVLVGAGFLVFRRMGVPRVRATTSAVDYLALILLGIISLLGIYLTLGVQWLGGGYDYRTTVSPWFRSLFTGNPDVVAITSAPIMYQVHATAAWMIFAVWPFSRLVHAWSYPLYYLWRPYVVYRRRVPTRPNEPGTSGRRWRRIGARY
ncbi:respiratory nitrate reductase subunit gamma [Pseudonocardia asaccharolytica]|uniref:Nitrate reductase-like protein NarX n=1 Tax=Pseudonocardia asaccharolytica DSM 44247 = NBRC 16224 TaxID=1123024 RepID=A0A511CYI6_9PSEU|nr:respiratory nitrate reductase subunit gamma [Pseudonocardia asaccharolytica]GEL17622.1 nitrate reductase subunit gamma [Pseudonocardia asaccharolytica DSM 44247 = NBRC 16224]